MKQTAIIVLLSIVFFSCNEKSEKRPINALDTGREFIRATLDGDYKTAETLLYKDSVNIQLFDAYERSYETMSAEKKVGYKKADIIVNNLDDANDSMNIINYSNSFMKQPTKLKLVKKDNTWHIDFKYTTGDSTSTK